MFCLFETAWRQLRHRVTRRPSRPKNVSNVRKILVQRSLRFNG